MYGDLLFAALSLLFMHRRVMPAGFVYRVMEIFYLFHKISMLFDIVLFISGCLLEGQSSLK